MIVCLEGLDAAGKGTHAAQLVGRMNAKLWKFPDRNTATGKLIYEHLEKRWWIDGKDEPEEVHTAEALVFQALQLANRMEVASEIFQAAAKGNVVFDRYWPSGYAYGKADGLSGDYLVSLHRWLPQPDLYVLLDIDFKHSVERRPDRRDRYEAEAGVMEKVIQNYRELWARMRVESPNRWVVVDARGSKEETAVQVNEAIVAYRALAA